MAIGPVALLASFYASAITLWVVGLAFGWAELAEGEEIYALVLGLYALLSIMALRTRPKDRRVRVFVVYQAMNALTIVWPVLDVAGRTGAWLWVTMVGSSFIYALAFPLYLHLASVIPDRNRLVGRHRWFLPVHYGIALAIGSFTTLMYVDQVRRLGGGGSALLLPLGLDLEGAYRLDRLLNTGSYVYGGLGALLLLGTAAARYRSEQSRRQALVVMAGIAPWTLYMAWTFVSELRGTEGTLPGDLALQAGLILLEAVALFIAVVGYQLFDMGLVFRRGLVYGGAAAVCVGVLYVALLGIGELMLSVIGVQPAAWHLGLAMMALALGFHPMLRAVSRLVDRTFFPQKVRLRRLQRTLIPSLARRTDLDAMASYLTRRLRRSLGFRSAALLLPDDSREFYRVRALAGSFRFRPHAGGAVITGEDLAHCWDGPQQLALVRSTASWQERLGTGCRDLPAMLELIGADYLVPFRLGDDLVGVLALGGGQEVSPLDRDDLAHLELLAQQASAMLENARLFHLARHDALTGLPRRRVFEERFALELSRAARDYAPVAVAMIDIDDFKDVNDRFGHLVGDRALRSVADVMRGVSRSTDVVARYGGEEFVMLLPGTDERGAEVVATKLRDALNAHPVVLGPQVELLLTVSIGIAVVTRTDVGHDMHEFVRRADHALYDAKLGGKDRFEVFGGRPFDAVRTTRVVPGRRSG